MAKPILGTNAADTLVGTAAADKIKALGGNDKITDLGDGDRVDGGQGIDWATFGGLIDDYLIDLKGTGNNKVTVTSDGGDVIDLKQVEYLVFDNGTPGDFLDDSFFNTKLGTVLRPDATVDEVAQDPAAPGTIFAGTGNLASDYVVVQNPDHGIELGFQVKYRQGPTRDPVSIDDDGTIHFEVAEGGQSIDNGSFVDNASRAAWNFDWSVTTGLDGAPTDLTDFEFKMLVDTDITGGTDFLELTLVPGVGPNPSGAVWVDSDGNPVIGDDDGVLNQVTQNSQNFAFGWINDLIDGDPQTAGLQLYEFGQASFDIQLQAFHDGDLVAANNIVVDVGGGWDFV